MRVKEFKTKFNEIDIIAIGDVHLGDVHFTKECEDKLKGYINWVKKRPNAYIVLMGDILNCATRESKSSPFEQNMDLKDQINKAVELFKPVKDKILGGINGNHSNRIADFCGYSPMISICERLGITYMGDSGIYLIRMGCHSKKGSCRETFSIFTHHSVGGSGRTPGAKMNRADVLRGIVADCDVYCIGHNHMMGAIPAVTQTINKTTGKIETVRQMLVDCGSYLDWNNSYAERMQLAPQKLGSPKIKLIVKRVEKNGKETTHKDVHVSL